MWVLALLHGSIFSSLREELRSNSTKQSQEYYFMRLPRSLRLLAMTGWYPRRQCLLAMTT
ncbi:RND transporter [Rickettsia felis]|uniref:RND transporter n=1 Tax=Rickettsia felis TaxID=42862 RepID=UPI00158565A2|nr:RND transporter [Rickettsia felis]